MKLFAEGFFSRLGFVQHDVDRIADEGSPAVLEMDRIIDTLWLSRSRVEALEKIQEFKKSFSTGPLSSFPHIVADLRGIFNEEESRIKTSAIFDIVRKRRGEVLDGAPSPKRSNVSFPPSFSPVRKTASAVESDEEGCILSRKRKKETDSSVLPPAKIPKVEQPPSVAEEEDSDIRDLFSKLHLT